MERRTPKIIEGVTHWICPTCRWWVPEDGYFKNRRAWNGISNQCKECHTEGSIRTRNAENHRAKTREYAKRDRLINPEKYRIRERLRPRRKGPKVWARQIVNLAIRCGAIQKPTSCSDCGEIKKITAHHENYKKPLDIVWLCHLCHARRHRVVEFKVLEPGVGR